MSTNIQDSVVATGKSKVNINITKEKKKFFWNGFFVGVMSSVIGGGIWYLIEIYVIK